MKYPISREFFPYTHFVAPITRPFLMVAGVFMRKVPRFVRCHPALDTENFTVADGVLYAELLGNAGVETQLHEVPSAMHGFDTKVKAPTSQRMIRQRAEYMRRRFDAEA